MISRAVSTWNDWPTWAKWTSGIGAVVLIEAVMVASGERNFAAGLVQHSAALVLRYSVMVLAFGGGYWLGVQVAKRTRQWLGWLVGIAFALSAIVAGYGVVTSIPGIGWRVTAMMNSDCSTDWDGRSNSTACD